MKLLLADQLAAFLNVSPTMADNLVQGDAIKYVVMNKQVYFIVDDEWIHSHQNGLL